MRLFSLPGTIGMHFLAYTVLLIVMKAVPAGAFVLVISNPQGGPGNALDIISRSDGQFVEATRFDWLTVAYSERADFASRLRHAGAMAVINYPGAAGCLQRSF